MRGEIILSCFVIFVAALLVSQAIPESRWNFDSDADELDDTEMQKRSGFERQKRLCGVSSRRQGRCRMGVRGLTKTFFLHEIRSCRLTENFHRKACSIIEILNCVHTIADMVTWECLLRICTAYRLRMFTCRSVSYDILAISFMHYEL